jgi:hypothetical protein
MSHERQAKLSSLNLEMAKRGCHPRGHIQSEYPRKKNSTHKVLLKNFPTHSLLQVGCREGTMTTMIGFTWLILISSTSFA